MSKKSKLLAKIAELRAKIAELSFKRPNKLTPLVQRQADKVVKEMADLGHLVTIFQGFRSFAEQDALYAQGRTKPGAIVTNAKGGYSLHQYGVATDIVFVVNGRPSWSNSHPWDLLGRIYKKHGFDWGGSWVGFKDMPHGEMTLGYTLYDFLSNKVDYRRFL